MVFVTDPCPSEVGMYSFAKKLIKALTVLIDNKNGD
jgi:hypothetical protein